MLFFEAQFFQLFACFFLAYWLLTPARRPLLILIVSLVFYGLWDWRFLSLLGLSIIVDFVAGQGIEAATGNRPRQRRWLALSLAVNLGALGFFKYFDFFSAGFADLFGVAPENRLILDVILPAGISFYTFQTLSYTLDVYRGEQKAERDPILFAAFVAFFPQLIAGPIERAGHLIHQIAAPQRFSTHNLYLGARLFLFGLVKKLVIADNLAKFVDPVFADPAAHDPVTLLMAAYAFGFQIYCDFSGYTDMARGLAKSVGIELSINFNFPYLATSVRDFWQRWHITLYSWLRDYLYRPLGGNRAGTARTYRNIMVVFLASGLWHGAGWNFILWGGIHGIYLCIERALAPTALGRAAARLPGVIKALAVFHLVTFAWIVFRCPDLATFGAYLRGLAAFSPPDLAPGWELFALPHGDWWLPALGGHAQAALYMLAVAFFCLPLMLAQAARQRWSGRPVFEAAWPMDLRISFYASLCLIAFWLQAEGAKQFIYFQF